nr:hypothetical protein [Tanacetum cinerariifolium]
MGINIDALYNILKQNQGDVNDAIGSKNKTVVVTSDPLALIAEKMKVSKSKEKVVVSLDSEGSEAYDFNELKKITAFLAKAFNQRKFYSKPTNNNLRTSSTSQSANKKQEFVKNDKKKVEKKDDEKKRDMSRVKCYNCKKEGYFVKDCKKVKVKDYEYYKTKMLLAKKDKDEQVLLAKDQAWMESSSDSDQEINANIVFMAQIDKVLSDSEVAHHYYDNSTDYGLFVNNDDDQEIFYDAIESASENFIENHIDSQKDYDKSDVDHNDSEEKDHLVDKLIRKFNKKIVKCQKRIEKANQQSKDFENQNKDLQDKYDVLKEQLQLKHVLIDTHAECQEKYAKLKAERYEYMIRYSAYFDNDKHHRKQIADQEVLKGIGFENPSYFEKAKDLRPTLYDEKVIGLGYTLIFLTHSNEALKIEKFKRSRENKIEFSYDYENLNASYVNEKINFEDDYFQDIIKPDFEKIDSPFQQTSSLKPYVSNVILENIIIDLEDEVVNLLEKEKKMIVLWLKKSMTKRRIQRMCDLLDDNNFFIFDDESVRISPVSKMPFRKKSCDSMIVQGSDADDFSELKKITALLAKAFNRRKFYSKPTNNNLRTSSTSQSANKKQEFVKSDDKQVMKKAEEKKRDISKVKCYNCKKEGHFIKDCKKVKVKDYEYYETKMVLAKKDKDEQVFLAEDQAWMESSSDSDQEI